LAAGERASRVRRDGVIDGQWASAQRGADSHPDILLGHDLNTERAEAHLVGTSGRRWKWMGSNQGRQDSTTPEVVARDQAGSRPPMSPGAAHFRPIA
jgi:hypothetical protein